MSDVKFDSGKAMDFLLSLPGGAPCISAVHVDPVSKKKGLFETRSFPPDCPEAAGFAWIEGRQRKSNIYFTLQPLIEPMDRKPANKNIKSVVAFHVDIDPREGEPLFDEQKRIILLLQDFKPRPHVVIASGGGFQALWFLCNPIPIDGDEAAAEDAKLYNLALERKLGGDHCHDIGHILRVPYTVNVAHDLKIRKGRPEFSETSIVWDERHGDGFGYPLSSFEKADPQQQPKVVDTFAKTSASASGGVTPKVEKVGKQEINHNEVHPEKYSDINVLANLGLEPMALITLTYAYNPGELREKFIQRGWEMKNDKPFGGDRSDMSHFLIHALVRAGLSNEDVTAVVRCQNYKEAFGHIHDQKEDKQKWRAVCRSLEKARNVVAVAKFTEDTGFNPVGGIDNRTGHPNKNVENTMEAIKTLGIKTWKNTFNGKLYVTWPNGASGNPMYPEAELDETVGIIICNTTYELFGFFPNDIDVSRGLLAQAQADLRNPVVNDINKVEWDCTKRIDTMFIDYLGVEDTLFERAVTRKFLCAMVRRAKYPGCKFDHMLVIDGEEGLGKSLFLRDLAGSADVFSDQSLLHKSEKEQMELLEGIWLFEVGELAGLNRADADTVKSNITRTEDKGRKAYSRYVSSIKRSGVMAGTSNISDYMKVETGDRRFWPLTATKKYFEPANRAAFLGARSQLLAEAAVAEPSEDLYLSDELIKKLHKDIARVRRAPDPLEEKLGEIKSAIHPERKEKIVTIWPGMNDWRVLRTDVYAWLELPASQCTTAMHRRVTAIMKSLGWEKLDTMRKGDIARVFVKARAQGELEVIEEKEHIPF